MDSRWSDDAFLDSLRQQADPQADGAVARLIADGGDRAVSYLFRVLRANDDPIPDDAPEPFREFMEQTRELPPDLDLDRVQRGGDVFLRHAMSAATVLLASSLPRGYAAPCLCEILSISRDLQRHPYERLMGVVQLLVNISNPGSFQPQGRAILTAQKLRLLHAGVRTMVPRYRPHYREKFGAPVNHEDMLATIMAFSYLVIDGLRRLNLPLTEREAEDFYYLWRVFALLMGIHPEGRPHDASLIPATIEEAGVFYDSYVRRNDTPARENPYGVVLTVDNIRMMEKLLPKALRWVGFHYAPRICMTELMTPEELARVGMRPIAGHRVIQGLCSMTLSAVQSAMSHLPFSSRLASLMFQDMIDTDRGGEVTFSVPITVYGLRGSTME